MHDEMLVSSYRPFYSQTAIMHGEMLVSSYRSSLLLAQTAIMHDSNDDEMLVSSYWSSLLLADSNHAW